MKKIVIAAVLFSMFAAYADDDPNKAYVDLPWYGTISQQRTPAKMNFSDGTWRAFYYWVFTESHLTVEEACNGYEQRYINLLAEMLSGGKISESQAEANMSKWVEMVTPKLSVGIAEQQRKYNNRLSSLDNQWKAASEAQKTQIEAQYNSLLVESTTKINSLQATYATAVSGVIELQNAATSRLQGELNTANEQMRSTTEALQNSLNLSVSEINAAKAASEKAALKVAELSKSISDLSKSSKGTQTTVVVEGGGVQYSTFTNYVAEVGNYLSSTNSTAYFRMPRKPNDTNNGMLERGKTIDDYLGDVGVVVRVDYGTVTKHNQHPDGNYPFEKYIYGFVDEGELEGGKTNTLAVGIGAPKNWADGDTIVCTDGLYRVDSRYVTTNSWNKLQRSLSALTNELFKAGGFTNNYDRLTNIVYGINGITNALPKAINLDNALDHSSVWTNGASKIEVAGFDKAECGTTPVVAVDGQQRFVEWKMSYVPDGVYGWYETYYSSLEPVGATSNAVQITGFANANVDTVPFKVEKEGGRGDAEYSIEWRPIFSGGSALKFIGTDGDTRIVGSGSTTNTVQFASAADSNVSVTLGASDDNKGVKVTIGVYYR